MKKEVEMMIPDVNAAVWPGWETVDMLGQGSFGAVYEIRRDVFGDVEKAALKVISIPQSKSELDEMYGEGYDEDSIRKNLEEQLKSIVSEYSLMRKLNGCANVVHCDDVRYEKKADGFGWNIYIKMELLHPLMQSLPQQVTEETVVRIGKEMCNALIHCGYHGIIHRDIKPQNMFLTADGSCKLGDFGIAKTIEKTTGGTKIGTFKYMAPEVYNNKPYGVASDIYSLGLVLYWLLNERRMPFVPLPPAPVKAGMDGDAANRRLMGEPIPEPKNGSVALKQIVLKACAYDPKDRFHSAAEMLNALENMKKEPLATSVSKPAQPVQKKDSDATLRVRQTPVPPKQSPLNLKPEPINHPVLKNIPPPPPEPVKSRSGTVWILLLSILIVAAVIGGIMVLISLAKNTPKQNKTPESSTYTSSTNQTESAEICLHTWENATFYTPKTCTRCGLTEGTLISVDSVDIEAEVAKTRNLYYEKATPWINGEFRKETIREGVDAYYDSNNELNVVFVEKGTSGAGPYSDTHERTYYYEDGKLIFALLEGDTEHRLYFWDELLIRWRCRNAGDSPEDDIIKDAQRTDSFMMMEFWVKTESDSFFA